MGPPHRYSCIFPLSKLVWAALLPLLPTKEQTSRKGSKFTYVKHILSEERQACVLPWLKLLCPTSLSSLQDISELIQTLAVTALTSPLWKRATRLRAEKWLHRVTRLAWGRIRIQAPITWLLPSLSLHQIWREHREPKRGEKRSTSWSNIWGFWFSRTVWWPAAIMPQKLWWLAWMNLCNKHLSQHMWHQTPARSERWSPSCFHCQRKDGGERNLAEQSWQTFH